MDIKSIEELENLLTKHLEILKKPDLNDKDIKLLLDSIKNIELYIKFLNKNIIEKEKLKKILDLISQIIELGNMHKNKILHELSKYNIRKQAFYSYNIENPTLKSINKKV